MSGGSWDYVYRHFEDAAERLKTSSDVQRKALGELVGRIAKAMHAIEWVDSCDYGPDGANEAIKAALGEQESTLTLEQFHDELKRLAMQIESILRPLS